MVEDGEQRFAENPSEIPVSPVGWRKPILAAFLSFLITGLGQAYNRQWRRTLGFVAVTLLLDLVFLHFRVWARSKVWPPEFQCYFCGEPSWVWMGPFKREDD